MQSSPHDLPNGQMTCYAESEDGIGFVSDETYLAPPYLRTLAWDGCTYGFAGGGGRHLYRNRNRRDVFEQGIPLDIEGEGFTDMQALEKDGSDAPMVYRTRHAAVHLRGHTLDIYYSNAGDTPERIKMTTVGLRGDWTEWRGSAFVEVLRTETSCEGVNEPLPGPSRSQLGGDL